MAAPPFIDRQTFLGNVRRSGLLSDGDLARIRDRLPQTERGRVVARALVELGVLTRFQAERLLAGRTAGFTLGQYRILDQIGRGGMGRVFKAQHAALGRVVAIKVLAPNLVRAQTARQLFDREVFAVGQMNHPNIVTAFDAYEKDGRVYLVFEFVDGPNLEELVRQQGPLPLGLACDYIMQAAAGLQAAHAVGIVHRDVKPANLLVHRPGKDAPGLVKVGDFGLARLREPGTQRTAATILVRPNTVMGTPDYLSPEQARNLHDLDGRTDLYSLGCTFFFLLTGRPPFAGGTAVEKVIRHTNEPPPRVSDLRPGMAPEVEEIVSRLLEKNPDDRYGTPAELISVLHPWAVSGPMPWASPPQTSVIETGPTPLAEVTPSPVDGVADAPDDLEALSAGVPDEALLAPPEECVLALQKENRRVRARRAWTAAAIIAANALFWWAVLHWK